MVVEDSEVVGHLLRVLLESEGYEVLVVPDGLRALERATIVLPDVILLDVSLPGMDGREVLRRLKEDPITVRIPVVVVSAFADALTAADRRRAAHVVAKPFDVDDLLQKVRTAGLLDAHRQ